jgi:hypothetical protein
MGLKIRANTLSMHRELEVFSDGVRFIDVAGDGAKRESRYYQIDHLFLGNDGTLAFQVGSEVFSLPIRKDRPDHLQALHAFLQGLERSRAAETTHQPGTAQAGT